MAALTSSSSLILEKKQALEEEVRRVEKQIYDLEGEYLQVCARERDLPPAPRADFFSCLLSCRQQETVKDGNILRGWDSYLGTQASSGAIRRINRFREADRMFSASSVTSGQVSTFNAQSAQKVCSIPPASDLRVRATLSAQRVCMLAEWWRRQQQRRCWASWCEDQEAQIIMREGRTCCCSPCGWESSGSPTRALRFQRALSGERTNGPARPRVS